MSAPIIYLDIETIPGSNPLILDYIKANLKPPAQMKKAETIDKWWTEKSEQAAVEIMQAGGLHAEYGEIACIGMAVGDGDVKVLAEKDEYTTLNLFMRELYNAVGDNDGRLPVFVGHNSNQFDLPFIYRRAVCCKVPTPEFFPTPPEIKAWSERLNDTMVMWSGIKERISLDRLAFALGMNGKGDIDGSMVAGLWANGEKQRVIDYCKADVGLTRKIYKRLTFVV